MVWVDGGAEGIRTPYPFLAKEMLSRMSYSPVNHYYNNNVPVGAIKSGNPLKTVFRQISIRMIIH